ncbi:J domain-containing protein [Pseudonocardia sp. HH130629-09]|uniref:J domain-containing protein n=1 Tax=Pseudonocardia sp. HH130629-09 TaxID=1641402 RepID=UPI0007610318|nr:J domain-containing protein [Pseudonocardia sp. HH130629-09]
MTLHPDLLGRDLYADLGVDADATLGQLRSAYRRLALTLHPDRNPDPAAAARFGQISTAYAVLSHPHRRADYDATRAAQAAPHDAGAPGAGTSARDDGVRYDDYAPAGCPVIVDDYVPATPSVPHHVSPHNVRRSAPEHGGGHGAVPQGGRWPAGWPVGQIDVRRVGGRLLLGIWRLVPLPHRPVAAVVVLAAVLLALVLALAGYDRAPVEALVVGTAAAIPLACWTVRVLTLAAVHRRARHPRPEEVR